MKDDRLRISVEPAYIASIGRATFAFATLEWNAVWCCEKIAPGSIDTLPDKTAGVIAREFVKQVKQMPSTPDRARLLAAAEDFKALVEDRNGLMHGKPGTDTTDGGQCLFRHGKAWTIDTIDAAGDRFTECSIQLNEMLYGFLK